MNRYMKSVELVEQVRSHVDALNADIDALNEQLGEKDGVIRCLREHMRQCDQDAADIELGILTVDENSQ